MTNHYTPTTDDLREWYASGHVVSPELAYVEWDAWIASHDADIQAAALRDARDRMPAFHDRDVPEWAITSACKWLERRADELDGGTS